MLLALLCTSALSFAQGTITSGAATFVRNVSGFDVSPSANFTGVTSTAASDQLFEFGWWYRVSGDTAETPFPTPTTQNYTGDTSTLVWTDVNGRGFNAREVCVVVGIASPVGGKVACTMTITNPGASPLAIDLFVFADIDLGGSASGDNATLGIATQRIDLTEAAGTNTAQFAGVGANALLVRPFAAATDVAGLLSDALVTNFDNSGLPATNIDFTGGFQWTATIPAGGSRDFVSVVAVNTTALISADLSITKTDGVTTATPGGSVTYTITASNAGPDAAAATVADTFPASLTCTWTCVGAGGGTCTASGSGNINDTVNLPAGASTTYTASCTISASATGTLSNTATVTATTAGLTDPTPGNNSATDTDALGASADLAVTITDTPDPVTAGAQITYTINASNAGPSNAATVAMSVSVPANTTFVSLTAPGGWACTTPAVGGTGVVNCSLASLANAASASFTLVVAVAPAFSGSISATASLTTATTDPVPGNNSQTTTTAVNALTFPVTAVASGGGGTISCASPVVSGSTTTCTLTPNAGYRIASVSGCGGVPGSTSPYTTGVITAACTVTAVFVLEVPRVVPTIGFGAIVLLTFALGVLGIRRRHQR